MEVGQEIIIPEDPVLGCAAERVVILEIHPNSMRVRQLTEVNGAIGEFSVSLPNPQQR
jgi:hypothetical protein